MKNFINFLPPWVETNMQPAFYDKESGSCLQQTARMYAKVNQLVRIANEQWETIQDYINQFIELRNFCEDYFDNLDVQEEINNKLDKMAQDGSLGEIFMDSIEPVIAEQNSRISEINTKVNNVASGSPAGVYATVAALTSADPNHNRIYVVTADGHWYYWSDSQEGWADGGEYQAVLESGDLTLLGGNLVNLYNPDNNKNGYWSYDSGTDTVIWNESTAATTGVMPVTPSLTYYLYRKNESFGATNDYFVFLDNEDNVISFVKMNSRYVQIGDTMFSAVVAPVGCNRVEFSVRTINSNWVDSTIFATSTMNSSYNANDLLLRNVIENTRDNYTKNIYKLSMSNRARFVASNNNDIQINSRAWSAIVPVEASTTYYLYRGSQRYNVSADAIFFRNGETLLQNVAVNSIEKVTTEGKTFLKFTTPASCNNIVFNLRLATSTAVLINDYYTTILAKTPVSTQYYGTDFYAREAIEEIKNYYTTRLAGKTWCVIGDSITEHNYRAEKNYHDFISDRCDITVVNKGISAIGYVKSANSKTIVTVVNGLDNSADYDYITVFAGTNDYNQPLGELSDTGTTTVCGAVKTVIETLITKFPTKKIALITPLPRATYHGTLDNNNLYKISEAIKKIAENYSIPVLNLYETSGLRPWNADNNETFFSCEEAPQGDGLHPNALGHEWISYPIQDLLETL